MKIEKSTTLSASSVTEDGKPIAYFNASIGTTGTTNNFNITSPELYEANKVQVRKDKADFDAAVYAVEDANTTA